MKTKETLTKKQIYITVVTSGLTMLANKVARIIQPNENIFDACSELANEIAKENDLEWSNVLMQYYLDYDKAALPQFDNWRIPAKPKSTRQQALEWWNNLPDNDLTGFKVSKASLIFKHLGNVPYERMNSLTDKEIEDIWKNERLGCSHNHSEKIITDKESGELVTLIKCEECGTSINSNKPNQKQFKEFNPDLFKAYIDKFSNEDKLKALMICFQNQSKSCPIELVNLMIDYTSK